MLPLVSKAAKLGRDIIRFHGGGFTPDEGRQIAADALDLAGVVVSTFAPAPIGSLIGGLLSSAGSSLAAAHSPAEFAGVLLDHVQAATAVSA